MCLLGTFSIPITKDPQPPGPGVYELPKNDLNGMWCRQLRSRVVFTRMVLGQDTLHGGVRGWDRRNWTIVSKTPTSVTYHHLDAADEDFPGNVSAFVRASRLFRV